MLVHAREEDRGVADKVGEHLMRVTCEKRSQRKKTNKKESKPTSIRRVEGLDLHEQTIDESLELGHAVHVLPRLLDGELTDHDPTGDGPAEGQEGQELGRRARPPRLTHGRFDPPSGVHAEHHRAIALRRGAQGLVGENASDVGEAGHEGRVDVGGVVRGEARGGNEEVADLAFQQLELVAPTDLVGRLAGLDSVGEARVSLIDEGAATEQNRRFEEELHASDEVRRVRDEEVGADDRSRLPIVVLVGSRADRRG